MAEMKEKTVSVTRQGEGESPSGLEPGNSGLALRPKKFAGGSKQVSTVLGSARERLDLWLEAYKVPGRLKIEMILRGGRPRPFALVGPSGTGKSFRACLFAEHHDIPFIIDDGILIEGRKILAGHSAKVAKHYFEAVKIALFEDREHLEEVTSAIRESKVRRILLVGTSIRMVRLVAKRLDLPPIADNDIISIEEISSAEEIKIAKKNRSKGRHVIPVPALEVSKYRFLSLQAIHVFLSDLRGNVQTRFHRLYHRGKRDKVFENTEVLPAFQGLPNQAKGRITISPAVLQQLVLHCIDEYAQDIEVSKIRVRIFRNRHTVFLKLSISYGPEIGPFLNRLKNYIINNIHRYTGILIQSLSIELERFEQKSQR